MATLPALTPEQRAEVMRLYRDEKVSVPKLAARFRVSDPTIRRVVDPKYRDYDRTVQNRKRARLIKESPHAGRLSAGRPTAEDVERLRADIPADTRDLTARILGDPLPGRSALDRRNEVRYRREMA